MGLTALQKVVYWLDRTTPFFKFVEERRATWFVETFPIKDWLHGSRKILDIGCGVGDITCLMQQISNAKVIAIDKFDYRRQGICFSNPFLFQIADASYLHFPSNYFDCVTLFWSLHHMAKPSSALAEALRVLKPNGRLLIAEDVTDNQSLIHRQLAILYDKFVNLDFRKQPHTNMTLYQWDILINNITPVRRLDKKIVTWPSSLPFITFAAICYKKL
jgi:ubiquinone/menaquinone biosynthesis C-methylase UbiE